MSMYKYVNKTNETITVEGVTLPPFGGYTYTNNIPSLDILSDGWSIDRYLNGVLSNTNNDPATESKEPIVANKVFYVRKDGNNNNAGVLNTASGAFLTIQYALEYVRDYYRFNYSPNSYVTINIGDGIYEENLVIPQFSELAGVVFITGNEDVLDAVTIYPVGGSVGVRASGALANVTFSGITFDGSRLANYGIIIRATNAATVNLNKNIHIKMANGVYGMYTSGALSYISTWDWNPMNISGNCRAVGYATNGGNIFLEGSTLNVGTLTCSEAFLRARRYAKCTIYWDTVTGGTVTGLKYAATSLSLIDLDGGFPEASIPGTVAGTLSTGSVLSP